MKLMKNFIFIFLSILSVMGIVKADRFNTDYLPQTYVFEGLFGFKPAPYSDPISYKINTLPEMDIPMNKLIRLQPLISDRWKSVLVINGTKLILSPQISSIGTIKSKLLYSLPYVVIEGADDFITIYLYCLGVGNKLVFNILAFEQFMRNTNLYQGLNKNKNMALGWEFGFEFDTIENDFVASYGKSIFNIDLHWKNNTFTPAQELPLFSWPSNAFEILALLGEFKQGKQLINVDKSKVNQNLLFDNNIISKSGLTDYDVTHVEKILTDAGFKITTPTSTEGLKSSE